LIGYEAGNAPLAPPSPPDPASDSGVAEKSPADPDGPVVAAITTAGAAALPVAGRVMLGPSRLVATSSAEEATGVCVRQRASFGVVSTHAGSSTKCSRAA